MAKRCGIRQTVCDLPCGERSDWISPFCPLSLRSLALFTLPLFLASLPHPYPIAFSLSSPLPLLYPGPNLYIIAFRLSSVPSREPPALVPLPGTLHLTSQGQPAVARQSLSLLFFSLLSMALSPLARCRCSGLLSSLAARSVVETCAVPSRATL